MSYSSFFGGSGDDRIRDLWRDPCGGIIFGGDTYSANLPTSDDVFQDSYVGSGDSYIAKFNLLISDVDFSGDGKVNFGDYSRLAQYWSQDESLVDNAPQPFGDNIIDFKDEGMFVENWFTGTKIPPLAGQASNPSPHDGAVYVSTTADLSCTAGTDANSHVVYFGMSGSPPFILNQITITYDPGIMDISTKYYWRIDSVNDWGKTVGQVWCFTTLLPPP